MGAEVWPCVRMTEVRDQGQGWRSRMEVTDGGHGMEVGDGGQGWRSELEVSPNKILYIQSIGNFYHI